MNIKPTLTGHISEGYTLIDTRVDNKQFAGNGWVFNRKKKDNSIKIIPN